MRGKRIRLYISKLGAEDHPRGCGENPAPLWAIQTRLGSPPRMRGKLHRETTWAAAQRITPADAGKTPTADGSAVAM